MGKSIQVNVRVADEADRSLVIAAAERLRRDPAFRERLAAFLDHDKGGTLAERVKQLEQQVSRLASGAIVVPRPSPSLTLPSRLGVGR